MKVFLAALILVGAGVFAMCFNVIFLHKDFPSSDVGSNENMRKKGIRCMKEIDDELFLGKEKKPGKGICDGNFSDECRTCGLFELEKKSRS